MSNPFVAEIRIVGFNFAPRGWALCDGQILPIAQNTALFSLLGTFYGGNGTSNFALPDLRARVPIAMGQGPGLSDYAIGESGGTATVTLTTQTIPAHTHPAKALAANGNTNTPNGTGWAQVAGGRGAVNLYGATPNTPMNATALASAGSSQPHNNMGPFLGLLFCIALQGIFPARS